MPSSVPNVLLNSEAEIFLILTSPILIKMSQSQNSPNFNQIWKCEHKFFCPHKLWYQCWVIFGTELGTLPLKLIFMKKYPSVHSARKWKNSSVTKCVYKYILTAAYKRGYTIKPKAKFNLVFLLNFFLSLRKLFL